MVINGIFDTDVIAYIGCLILGFIAGLVVANILRSRGKKSPSMLYESLKSFFDRTDKVSNPRSKDESEYENRGSEWRQPPNIAFEAGNDEVINAINQVHEQIWNGIKRLKEQNDNNHEMLLEELRGTRDLQERPARQKITRHSPAPPLKQRESYQPPPQKSHYVDRDTAYPGDPLTESLCRSYNESVRDKRRQRNFKDEHNPVRVHVTNYMDRAKDSTISPEFREDHRGDFEAIRYKDGKYMVVPRFEMTIRHAQYGPGAIGEVFICHDYTSNRTYQITELIQPAIFTNDGENWEMAQPGELRLS